MSLYKFSYIPLLKNDSQLKQKSDKQLVGSCFGQYPGPCFGQYPGPNGNKDPGPPKKLYLLVDGLGLVHRSNIGLITNQFVHKT